MQGLAATYQLDAGPDGLPFSVSIRFVGTRMNADGRNRSGDRFERVERVEGIVPGSGPVTVTARVTDVRPGTWRVTATPVRHADAKRTASGGAPTARLMPRELTAHTRPAPLAYGPGVRVALWPALVGLGVLIGMVLQAVLLARSHVNVPAAETISLASSLVGYVASKAWYLALHRQHPRTFLRAGACIQGFILGGIGTMALAVAAFGLPLAAFLDASTPGLFVGMAVGRPGCFFTGCCSGRPTTSRWGLWSSDRRVGIRRVPIQLIEAVSALLIAATTLVLVLTGEPAQRGALFVGALAAYTLLRQVLFPFRAEPRTTSFGRRLTLAASAVALVTDVVLSVFH